MQVGQKWNKKLEVGIGHVELAQDSEVKIFCTVPPKLQEKDALILLVYLSFSWGMTFFRYMPSTAAPNTWAMSKQMNVMVHGA